MKHTMANVFHLRNAIKEYDTSCVNSIFLWKQKVVAMTIAGEASWKKAKNILGVWWMRRDTFLVLERWGNKLEPVHSPHSCEEAGTVLHLVSCAGHLRKILGEKMQGKEELQTPQYSHTTVFNCRSCLGNYIMLSCMWELKNNHLK